MSITRQFRKGVSWMSHVHAESDGKGRNLAIATILMLAYVVIEGAVGWYSNSLSILADAGHSLVDSVALVVSWVAIRLGRCPSSRSFTFGWHRSGILAALFNAVSLVVIAILIVWEAIERIRQPPLTVQGPLIVVMASIGIALNIFVAFRLRRESEQDLNVRSAYLHVLNDAMTAVGVIVIGVIVALTGWSIVDPIGSLFLGAYIAWSSWGLLKESIVVLLEGAPREVDLTELEREMRSHPGVLDIHDLHVWTIGSGRLACTCHVRVADQLVTSAHEIRRGLSRLLERRFGITHATLQVEADRCEVLELFCQPRSSGHTEGCQGHTH